MLFLKDQFQFWLLRFLHGDRANVSHAYHVIHQSTDECHRSSVQLFHHHQQLIYVTSVAVYHGTWSGALEDHV